MDSQLNDKLNEIIARCGVGGLNVDIVTLLTGMLSQISILQAKVDAVAITQSDVSWGGQNIQLPYTPENVADKVIEISTTYSTDVNYPSEKAVVSFVESNYTSSSVVDTILTILEKQSSDFKILAQEVSIIQAAITGRPLA